jgi:hypothetical protein
MIKKEVPTGVDTAPSRLFGGGVECPKVALYPRQTLGGDIKPGGGAEIVPEDLRPRNTDRSVGTGLRRVGSSLVESGSQAGSASVLGLPSLAASWMAVTHWAPKPIKVFGVAESDCRIGQADIQQCERARGLRQVEAVTQNGSLRDLVPEILHVAVPEFSNLCLLGSMACAVDEPKTPYPIEASRVILARQRGRRCGQKLAGAQKGEQSNVRPLGKVRSGEVRCRELIISRRAPGNEHRRNDVRSVAAPNG